MSELDTPSPWGLILAGGDGTRLRPLTRRIVRDERPKQFCPVLSNETLLEQTLRRAALLVSPDRTLAVVVRAHERFYAAPGRPPGPMHGDSAGESGHCSRHSLRSAPPHHDGAEGTGR